MYLETDPKTGDLILPLSDEMTAGLGWEVGDALKWTDNGDGTWSIKKKVTPLTLFYKYVILPISNYIRRKQHNE